ncbi:unnamed protein product [Oreochromis niloticus]|nr:unnamed protein product [Mustela putorius furo]
MTIQRVSKLDEGLYKCSISGGAESIASWLRVKESQRDHGCHIYLILRTVFTIMMVAALLLLLRSLS